MDPGAVDSREIQAAIERLTDQGVLSIGVRSRRATVHRVAQTIEHFPYDLLLISTHCGDASGWRWTYEFADSEGIARTRVTDIAIGVQIAPGQDELRVTQFERFVSLDGVDWNDPERQSKPYHGQAMRDFARRKEEGSFPEPTKKEDIPRVPGSMALKMADHNYIALPQGLASALRSSSTTRADLGIGWPALSCLRTPEPTSERFSAFSIRRRRWWSSRCLASTYVSLSGTTCTAASGTALRNLSSVEPRTSNSHRVRADCPKITWVTPSR